MDWKLLAIASDTNLTNNKMLHLLFVIPSPWNWSTAQVANIVAVVSAAATVYAIWYAYARNRKQDKKINDLAEIARRLETQNTIHQQQYDLQRQKMKSDAKPEMQKPKTSVDISAKLGIYIENKGKRAIVDNFHFPQNNEVEFNCYAKVIDTDESIVITGKSKTDKFLSDCNYSMFISFTDIYKNPYWIRLSGKGNEIEYFAVIDEDHYTPSEIKPLTYK
jgi:hypothetical protein